MTIAALPQPKADPFSERHAPPRMTFDEFLAWADEDTHAEWVNGKVTFLSASSLHQLTITFLLSLMQFWIDSQKVGGRVWTVPFLMRCQPDGAGREPDIVYVSEANLHRVRTNYLEGPGDLVIEIVSPESVRRDRIEKFAEYEAGGVGEYWLIDPVAQIAEFYIRDSGASHFRRAPLENLTEENGGTYTCALLGGLRIEVDWLWQDPHPSLFAVVSDWKLAD